MNQSDLQKLLAQDTAYLEAKKHKKCSLSYPGVIYLQRNATSETGFKPAYLFRSVRTAKPTLKIKNRQTLELN